MAALHVDVLEARGRCLLRGAACGVYAKLRLGKQKCTTSVLNGPLDRLVWDEEFVLTLEDDARFPTVEALKVSVVWGGAPHLSAQIALGSVLGEGNMEALPPSWFVLRSQMRSRDSKAMDRDSAGWCSSCIGIIDMLLFS